MNFNTKGPIIYVEDDEDDQFLLQSAVSSLNLGHELLNFNSGKSFLEYLYKTPDKPLVIFCDINMPLMNGLELRRHIISDDFLRKKSIPFIFYTTGVSKDSVDMAYDLTVQGFFQKANSMTEIKNLVELIINYWLNCKHPNT